MSVLFPFLLENEIFLMKSSSEVVCYIDIVDLIKRVKKKEGKKRKSTNCLNTPPFDWIQPDTM